MPTYKTSFGGKTLRLTADTPEQAATAARLYFAGRGKADDVAQEADLRGKEAIASAQAPTADASYPRLEPVRLGHFDPTTPEGRINLGLGGAAMGVAAPGAMLGLAKDTAIYGAAEGAEKLLGLPSWTGEAIGAVSPVKSLGKLLLGGAMGGAKKGAAAVASKSAEEIAAAAAEKAEARAIRKRALDIAERRLAIQEQKLAAKTAPKAAPKPGPKPVPEPGPAPRTEGATALKPEPEFIDESAVSLVAEPLPFKPRGTTKPATNLGGKAKPGPAATPPDKLEETLRASLDAIKEKKASKAALEAIAEKVETSPLQVPRIQIGAQRVGRQVGMTKEQVRQQAGPVLDEVRGEASPILPIEPFRKIIDTMKAIPPAEREAYVARATSGKAKAQIENIRRTLEHLGLLLPVGAAAGMASE